MELRWMWFAVVVGVTRAVELTAEEYYSMPALFELEPWEACLARRRALYCLGSFDLLDLPHADTALLRTIQEFSADKYHFNHTRIHRGYCVSSRCSHLPPLQSSAASSTSAASLRSRFEQCVDNITRSEYGLRANLTRLEYCRTSGVAAEGRSPRARALPALDLAFASCCGLILLLNLLGTAYDVLRNQDDKPNRYLITWSVRVNWARLTATHGPAAGAGSGGGTGTGDPRLTALRPVQGMKALTLLLVMLAHSVLAYHLTYIQNPVFLERASHHPLSAYFQNGTSIVHTFFMVSSFLLAYNLLLLGEERRLGLRMLPGALLHRLARIVPVYAVVVGAAATWWQRAADGPLWEPLVAAEARRCRDKWWTQFLFINNFVRPDVKCLIHTWFLAVDMQLYVVGAVLTLWLGGRARARALPVLAALLAAAVLGNGLAAYYFDLRPMVTLMFPEYMRRQFEGEVSFTWLYQAPWDGAPAALLGLLAAFTYHAAPRRQPDLPAATWFRCVYRVSVPLMFAWVFLGYYMKGVTSRAALAAYAALDRPVFIALTATAMIGFFNKIDSVWWRFLSWRGWEVVGRMSLSIYLVHWLLALTQLAVRHHASPASVHEIGGHFLWIVFVSYGTALPLHLLVELPMQKFLQTLLT